ncbi:putative peptidylprolyl isomerase [Lupinus albus]|uniref:Serine/threonine-protein phosphatase 2A activator n=1 Tax=Lupinus albus TaxID=3870 RepID=A0A6A4P3F3_LUPAL|nr:putative peptidylprolyl isomerase [Lupinus albus]
MDGCNHHPQLEQQTPTSSSPPIGTCCKCGGPTTFAPPPPSPSYSEISPPPTYRPIRAPAIPPDPTSQRAIMLAPIPQSHPVPPLHDYNFITPTKRIRSPDDIHHFHNSDSGKHFLGFIVSLSDSVRGRKISDPCHVSQTVTAIVSILETLTLWVDEIPPVQQAARYGNIAYRTWHEKLVENAESLMTQILHEDVKHAKVEIAAYFTDSFGNASRIDYGTGHETNFAAWLYCLARLEEIVEQDYTAVVSRVFVKYIDLMRKLQLVYCLEPAGSHGVWGLDDYQFLPGVPNWNKVNTGLLKMYKAEVLEKVPIMQHFLFGSIIEW